MGATIHPHKGYLNTNFNIHVTGHEEKYSVYQKGDSDKCLITTGIARPNEPHILNIAQHGDFVVSFNDSDEINIHIEDGYKFGGSTYKTSFIFDDCPWCFVVMHDRTYFYNRETKRSFVEPISPDKITEINEDYVILENGKQVERTIFSLVEEKPILCICDIIVHNRKVIVWTENIEGKDELCVYVLGTNIKTIEKFRYDGYVIDEANGNIIFYEGNTIKRFSLSEYNSAINCKTTIYGKIISVVAPNIAVSYRELYSRNELTISSLETGKVIRCINLDGFLAEINGKELINIWQRQKQISEFDFSATDVPELSISASYCKVFIYPCEWDIFYSLESTSFARSNGKSINRSSQAKLYSVNSGVNVEIKQARGKFFTSGNAICFSNGLESFVRSTNYDGSGYSDKGEVYIDSNSIYLYKDSCLYKLSRNGYWDDKREINLDFSRFDEFGIVKDKETEICQTLSGVTLGKWKFQTNYDFRYVRTSEFYIFFGAKRIKATVLELPKSISASLKFGLSYSRDGMFLCHLKDGNYVQEPILEGIYDTSNYKDVLLSENGLQIMHRDQKQSIVQTIDNGDTQIYENLSYVSHVNGIRPLFVSPCSLLPRIVNPISGQTIDCNLLKQYQFVSPNGELYAETNLDAYTEYYHLITKKCILSEEYIALRKKYSYGSASKDSERYQEVLNMRISFVKENIDFLKTKELEKGAVNRSESEWIDYFANRNNIDKDFTNHFIEKRGVAVIKSTSTQAIVEKIHFGEPLWFLNYVSFSQDNRYVALGGRYPDDSSKGGLLLVYDLANHKRIAFNTSSWAVWTTAFTKNGLLGAYSSEPITYLGKLDSEMEIDSIEDRSFLTFSPDGKFVALSNLGYTSKYDKHGNERLVWGHQPSTNVYIAQSDSPSESIKVFDDLSDEDLVGCSNRKHNFSKTVASVSFSNDNKRLMMVGNDGVVIIRNLHLENYASK